jgi:hypothetical protein
VRPRARPRPFRRATTALPTPSRLPPLPAAFASTRESLHALACYVIAPARKQATGRIGLVPTPGGFGTPPFGDDAMSVKVEDDRIVCTPGREARITTVRTAATIVGVELQPDPGVGRDVPPFEPDRALTVDVAASRALAGWYAFGAAALAQLRARLEPSAQVSEATLWPEHFDLALVVHLADARGVNVGFSAGDASVAEPYAYVGPFDPVPNTGDDFWNAPFGATCPYSSLAERDDAATLVGRFFAAAFDRLGGRRSGERR